MLLPFFLHLSEGHEYPVLLEDKTLCSVASKLGKTPAQVNIGVLDWYADGEIRNCAVMRILPGTKALGH